MALLTLRVGPGGEPTGSARCSSIALGDTHPGALPGCVTEGGWEIPRVPHFDSFNTPFEAKPDYFLTVRGGSMDRAGF